MNTRSEAWRLSGWTDSEPGELKLENGRLAFLGLCGGAFSAEIGEIRDLRFPWYYFGGGLTLRIGGDLHRLSFVRPNDCDTASAEIRARLGDPTSLLQLGRICRDVKEGRRLCARWRAALSPGR